MIAILGEVLEADAKIPRKQRFKGNHCWKLALFEENKVLHIERGVDEASANTDILDFVSWKRCFTGLLGGWGYDSGV